MGAICTQFFKKPLLVQSATTTSALFGEFLPRLRAMFPYSRTRRIKLVLDNARAHWTHAVRDIAEKYRIDLWFMPAYSPELNAIETLWSVIKRDFRRRICF